MSQILVIYYSTYGHVETMAEAVAEGAREVTGGTPYGVTTIAKVDGSRVPSANELEIARFQGAHVADITRKLTGG